MQSSQAAPGGGGVVIAVVLNLIRTKSPLMQSDKGSSSHLMPFNYWAKLLQILALSIEFLFEFAIYALVKRFDYRLHTLLKTTLIIPFEVSNISR
jgi:ABC-type sulfate transport system permease subunit